MERPVEQCEHKQSEESCEVCTPKKEWEKTVDISEYDYHKRIWF